MLTKLVHNAINYNRSIMSVWFTVYIWLPAAHLHTYYAMSHSIGIIITLYNVIYVCVSLLGIAIRIVI
jgi:hypothetical protein